MASDQLPAPLCGHSEFPQRIGIREQVALCGPCFDRVRGVRRDYLAGDVGLRDAFRSLAAVAGPRQAVGACRTLLLQKLVTRVRPARSV